jgi:tyrosine-protein kinase Etk/Wzc
VTENEKIITFADVKGVFLRGRKRALKISLAAALLFFLLKLCLVPPKYQAEASFHESFEKQEVEGLFRSFIGITNSHEEAKAAAFMKAHLVLKPLIEKLGLQASVQTEGRISGVIRCAFNNIKAERGRTVTDNHFVFSDVVYEGEKGQSLFLRFTDESSFEIRLGKKKLCKAVIGEKVKLEEISFTLNKAPSNIKRNKNYPLTFSPWVSVASFLRKNLEILPDKVNRNILQLKLIYPSRFYAARIVNGLMKEYQKYLKDEQNLLAKEQLSYLERRQEELESNLEKNLSEHAAYLEKNLGEKGFVGLEQELDSLLAPQHEILAKSYDLDLEELHLGEEGGDLPLVSEGPIVGELQRISREKKQLKGERDAVELSLEQKKRSPSAAIAARLYQIDSELKGSSEELYQQASLTDMIKQKLMHEKDEILQKMQSSAFLGEIEKTRDDLKELRENISSAEALSKLIHTEEAQFITSSAGHSYNGWIDLLEKKKNTVEFEQCKEDFSTYLKNYVHLLHVKENILKERLFPPRSKLSEFEGIDLAQAKALYQGYQAKMDETQLSSRQLELLKEEIKNPAFEISSLGFLLQDSISQGLIAKASELLLKQKDVENSSQKDQKRIEEELSLQKAFLQSHISEMIKVKALSSSLIQEKIHSLQETTLDLINQQLSLLKEEGQDFIQQRKVNLQKEKKLLEQKREDLKKDMAYVPEKWRLEKQLKFKTELALKMMQAMTQLVESKTVGFQLQQVQSKPLDSALIPVSPKKPKLFFYSFLLFVLTLVAVFAKDLCKALFKGFPISVDLLKAWNQKVFGKISTFCDGKEAELLGEDLETLRKISRFLLPETRKGLVAAILGGSQPNYSFALADLLSKRGHKILLIDASFSSPFSRDEVPGFWQYLNGEISYCPIRRLGSYDFLPMGGYTRFGVEILAKDPFLGLLEEFKKSYDGILLFNRAEITSEEAKALLSLSERAVVSVRQETQEDLAPLVEMGNLGFVF